MRVYGLVKQESREKTQFIVEALCEAIIALARKGRLPDWQCLRVPTGQNLGSRSY